MSAPETAAPSGVRHIDDEEAFAIFDYQSRKLMGMRAEEFLQRWDAGEFHEQFDAPGQENLTLLVMMMTLVRPTR
jgi:hypothetical protein